MVTSEYAQGKYLLGAPLDFYSKGSLEPTLKTIRIFVSAYDEVVYSRPFSFWKQLIKLYKQNKAMSFKA